MSYQEPEFLPWDGRRVPLTFIGGYLGAGKTTLINEALARADRPIAVLVNDVGSVNIDAALIRRRSGDTIELTDGCVCCSLVDGFGAAFDAIRSRPVAPDHVVVELSGLALPDRVLPWGKSAGFVLDGVVVLVDAEQFIARLNEPRLADTMKAQVVSADLLVLTKVDLVDQSGVSEVRELLAHLAPHTPVIDVASAADASALLALGGRHPGGVIDLPDSTLFDLHVVGSRRIEEGIDDRQLDTLLDQLGPEVMRAKGIARMADGSLKLIQVVGQRRVVTPLPEPEAAAPTDLVVVALRDRS